MEEHTPGVRKFPTQLDDDFINLMHSVPKKKKKKKKHSGHSQDTTPGVCSSIA